MHMNILAAMVRRHCTLDIELACVTATPKGIDPSIRIIAPPGEWEDMKTSGWKGGRPSCYRRLTMFRPDAAETFGERFVCMDLDVVIGGNIDAILDRPEEIVLCGPTQIGPRWRYNGSMILMTAGCRPHVYEDFTPEGAEEASRLFVGSDQAWLGHALGPGEATWGPDEGVVRWGQAESGRMMFFPGHVKPWNALNDKWVAQHYRIGGGRTALVLGQKRSVWDDARRAMERDKVDGVLAFPFTVDQWPGDVDAVVESRVEALQVAAMLGFERTVMCGV